MECEACGHDYSVRDGMDPTPLCDQCAHKAAAALLELVTAQDSLVNARPRSPAVRVANKRLLDAWKAARETLRPNASLSGGRQ